MGKADRIIIKAHRVSAGLFLLAMIPAGYASFKRDTASRLSTCPTPSSSRSSSRACSSSSHRGFAGLATRNSTCRQEEPVRSIP